MKNRFQSKRDLQATCSKPIMKSLKQSYSYNYPNWWEVSTMNRKFITTNVSVNHFLILEAFFSSCRDLDQTKEKRK